MTRSFSSTMPQGQQSRTLEDAPTGLRHEFVDAIYRVAETTLHPASRFRLNPDNDLYLIVEDTLGVTAAVNPSSPKRQRIGRDLANAEWVRFYDVVERLWPEFRRVNAQQAYRDAANQILAAYGVAWDLGPDGRMQRVLPVAAQEQVDATFQELSGNPAFAPALKFFNDARAAYNHRPHRRDQEACADMFWAMESIAKIRMSEPTGTFYDALQKLRSQNRVTRETVDALERLNTLRNRHFGHGMTVPFALTPAEVDFAYMGCMSGALLFARLP